ncbi:MAG: hypothetical protein WC307_03880 [Candidatus Nanoarchaeia archaeon]|jgi:hypothetical protein
MRRSQYTLIVFIIAALILLSLTGIVTELINDKSDQIDRSQILLELGDQIRSIKSIQTQERQVGVDFTSIHLGGIGGWPSGLSLCGSSINDSADWLFKSVPYWYSGSETAQYYSYDAEVYNDKYDGFIVFKLIDIRSGLYNFVTEISNTTPSLLDGYLNNDSPVFLESGTHSVLYAVNKETLCDRTLEECSINDFTTTLPTSLTINRVITSGSEYETCVPDTEFIRDIYESFLNQYFKVMTQLAFEQIRDYSQTATIGNIDLPFFSLIEYEARVERVGANSLFINFYPLNLPLFNVEDEKKDETSIATYQGSTIVYDAFESNFISLQSIAQELINDNVLNEMINNLITKHSSFNVVASIEVTGSQHEVYDSLMGWNYHDPISTELDFTGFFGVDEIKPNCLYYLKEACQFLSDEVPRGLRSDYVYDNEGTATFSNGSTNDASDYLYYLYNEFTINQELPANWASAIESCQECHDIGKFNNPCINLGEQSCIDCFNTLTNSDYDLMTDEDECAMLINTEIKPLLNNYIQYRFTDLQTELNERYGYGWKLDAEKLNINSITFGRLDDSGSNFNSTCLDCTSTTNFQNCEFLESDLAIDSAYLVYTNDFNEVIQSTTSTNDFTGGINTDSEKELSIHLSLSNNGNTNEAVYLTVLIDAYNNLDKTDEVSHYLTIPLSDTLVSETIVTGDALDVDSIDDDGLFDFKLTKNNIAQLDSDTSGEYDLSLFTPTDYDLNLKFHLMRVCVHTAYNDEYDLSDNCVDFEFGVCVDGDLSRTCCLENEGDWLLMPSINYGLCCGDDDDFKDDFLANDNDVCYSGNSFNCPEDAPIAVHVRPISEARNYELPLIDYIDYYCRGEHINP